MGVVRYRLESDFDIKSINPDIRRFDGDKFIFTSTYSNHKDIFYGVAVDTTNNKNVAMSCDFGDPSLRAKKYDLAAHGTNLHSHSIITSVWSDTYVTQQLPITGFYAGSTTGVASLTLCE